MMKIQCLLVALIVAGTSMPGSAEERVIAEMDRRLDENPELACLVSYNLLVKVLSHQSQQNMPVGVPEIKLAPKERYMKDCLALPRMVQKCLVDQYAYHHMDMCQKARQEFEVSREKG